MCTSIRASRDTSRGEESRAGSAGYRRKFWQGGLSAAVAAMGLLLSPASHGQVEQTVPVTSSTSETHIPVVFSGGHATDPRDRGRPVILVAGALGVAPEVFREAFSHVHPAGPNSGGPTPDEARQNKAALMSALAPYGVTNDRLDTVSNYYRYVRSRGEHWPWKPAQAYAVVEKGVITRYVVTDGGSGYSSPPTITLSDGTTAHAKVQLAFGKQFAQNGSVFAISVGQGTDK